MTPPFAGAHCALTLAPGDRTSGRAFVKALGNVLPSRCDFESWQIRGCARQPAPATVLLAA